MEKEVMEIDQLIASLEEASDILDESYRKNDPQSFNKAKKLILNLQGKILEFI